MKVVCINDKNKPEDYDGEGWLSDGEIYTVDTIMRAINAPSFVGYTLKELVSGKKYGCFDSARFRLATRDDMIAAKLVTELIKETLTETVA